MPSRLSDLPALLGTPLGREQLADAARYRAWPLLARLAELHRRTLARRTRVVAVVGSLGKTTTARALLAVLGVEARRNVRLNSYFYAALAVLRIRPGDRQSVIEISVSRPGLMVGYARMLRPDVAVVTSIGSEHNRSFGTLEATRAEKVKMVQALPESGLAVLNGDDPNVRWMTEAAPGRVVTFGFDPGNDVRATDVTLDWPRGTRFSLHANGETRSVVIGLLGRTGVAPALAALAVAVAEGVALDDAIGRLETLRPDRSRLQPVALENGAWLLRDEHKATLESVDAALDVLAEVPAKRRIAVLGDVSEPPGSQGPVYRRLGERLATIADRAIFVGAAAQRYSAGARRAGMPADALSDAGRSVSDALGLLAEDLRPGDVVLLKGRDTQRLDRIALGLTGRPGRCDLVYCNVRLRCDQCPMFERGWKGRRPVMLRAPGPRAAASVDRV